MESNITNSLERIDNPILVILLAVLLLSNVYTVRMYQVQVKRTYELAVEMVGYMKDLNHQLGNIARYVQNGKKE